MNNLLDKIEGSTILVTGATGLIGRNIINEIIKYNIVSKGSINIVALVRSKEKAKRVFGENCEKLSLIIGDITEVNLLNVKADYIIHAASQTSSKGFISNPVETINVSFEGTKHLLEFARTQKLF